jgi:hypothetical protein
MRVRSPTVREGSITIQFDWALAYARASDMRSLIIEELGHGQSEKRKTIHETHEAQLWLVQFGVISWIVLSEHHEPNRVAAAFVLPM